MNTQSKTQYLYDAGGQRVGEALLDGDSGAVLGTTSYLNDLRNPTGYSQVLEQVDRDAGGGVVRAVSFMIGLDVIAQHVSAMLPADDASAVTTHLLLSDAHGSTRGLISAVGTLTQRFTYSAYGLTLTHAAFTASPDAFTRLLYSGEWRNTGGADGTDYLRARMYSPGSGRFVTTDPLGREGDDLIGLNKYLYGNGSPIVNLDPLGLMSLVETAGSQGIRASLAIIKGAAARGAVVGVLNYSIQSQLISILIPVERQLRALAAAIQPLSSSSSVQINNIANGVQGLLDKGASESAFAIFFATFHKAAGFIYSAYRIQNAATALGVLHKNILNGVTFNNGITFMGFSGDLDVIRAPAGIFLGQYNLASDISNLIDVITHYRGKRIVASVQSFEKFGRSLGRYGEFNGYLGRQHPGLPVSYSVWFDTNHGAFAMGANASLGLLLP